MSDSGCPQSVCSRSRSGQTESVTTSADDLHIDRHAAVERITLAPSSWVELIPGFVRDAPAAFTTLHDSLPWQQTGVLRYDRYVPERRLGTGVLNDAHPMLRQTNLHLRSRFRVPFTGVAAILYRDGETSKVCTVIVRCAGSTTP